LRIQGSGFRVQGAGSDRVGLRLGLVGIELLGFGLGLEGVLERIAPDRLLRGRRAEEVGGEGGLLVGCEVRVIGLLIWGLG